MRKDANPALKTFTMLLKCPDIHLASTVVTAVVEDAVIDSLLNGEEVNEWESMAVRSENLHDRLYNEHGEIVLAATGDELWDFYKDPITGEANYQAQIDSLVGKFIALNSEVIQATYDGYVIEDLRVIRAFKNQWLLRVKATKI